MKVFVVCTMLFAAALAAPGIMDNQVYSQDSSMASIFGTCAESADMATCLAVKGITALGRAARAANLEILPGIAFVR